MGVKYVRDFEFPAAAGFRDSAMPAKARASERGMPAAAKRGGAKYAKGGNVQKFQDGGFSRSGRPLPTNAEIAAMARSRVPAGGYQASDELKELQKFAKQQNMPQSYVDRIVNKALVQQKSPPARGLSGGRLGAALTAASALSGLAGYLAGRKKPTVTVEEVPTPQGKARGGRVAKYAKGGSVTAPAPRAPSPSVTRSAPAMLSRAKNVATGAAKRLATGPVGQAITANDVYNFVKDMYDNARQYDQGAYGELPQSPFKRGGKVSKVMREYKKGELHSGSKRGPVVRNPKQAIAIALSEARKAGADIPKKAAGGKMTPQDRRALEKMRHAEKYAPGLSLDMPGKRVKKK